MSSKYTYIKGTYPENLTIQDCMAFLIQRLITNNASELEVHVKDFSINHSIPASFKLVLTRDGKIIK